MLEPLHEVCGELVELVRQVPDAQEHIRLNGYATRTPDGRNARHWRTGSARRKQTEMQEKGTNLGVDGQLFSYAVNGSVYTQYGTKFAA